ncbi:hypothetical protein WH47_04549 [Habropoda laboriosa]|uniref:Uncharacterized protein n=1 Tax=Habropoda laboriosa TaxID=597456 RepID=A0A0L7R255_9HYME|nr:hypothetical protein WH47_04549 [Habropoda laboriosa]
MIALSKNCYGKGNASLLVIGFLKVNTSGTSLERIDPRLTDNEIYWLKEGVRKFRNDKQPIALRTRTLSLEKLTTEVRGLRGTAWNLPQNLETARKIYKKERNRRKVKVAGHKSRKEIKEESVWNGINAQGYSGFRPVLNKYRAWRVAKKLSPTVSIAICQVIDQGLPKGPRTGPEAQATCTGPGGKSAECATADNTPPP